MGINTKNTEDNNDKQEKTGKIRTFFQRRHDKKRKGDTKITREQAKEERRRDNEIRIGFQKNTLYIKRKWQNSFPSNTKGTTSRDDPSGIHEESSK